MKGLSEVDGSDMSCKKKEILKATWEYLMEKGLAKASIGDLCKEKKISQSSLYYWFQDKDDVWTGAGKYGVEKVALTMLNHTIKHVYDLDKYFKTLFDEVDKYKDDLRMLVQITTSPVFGKQMRETMFSFNPLYESYGAKLVEMSGCTPLQAEIFIYTIITLVVDYVIWEDREKSQMLLDSLYANVIEKTNLKQKAGKNIGL